MFTVAEIVKAVGGKLLQGKASLRVRGVSTDTRKVAKGEVFVAIKGDNFDGHNFTAQACQSGASVLLVSRADVERPEKTAVILVEDTVKALGYLARFHRRRFKVPVIAITGSAGKTTTKEFIAGVLSARYRVLYNKGTENNHIGVPMTLLKMTKKHQAAVIEAGTNHFGEIAWLGEIISPTVAVFTNIGQSHLAGLQSPEGVYKEKVTLIDHLMPKGRVVVNADDPLLRRILKKKMPYTVLTYGVDHKADVKAQQVSACGRGLEVSLGAGKSFQLPTPVWGNVSNALAAIACGQILRVPFKDMSAAIKRVQPAKGRQCFHELKGITIIDDTYNANPVSYHNAIRTLALVRERQRGKSYLVAADMLELGEQSDLLHRQVGAAAAKSGIDHLFTIGRWAGLAGEQAREINRTAWARHYEKREDILTDLSAMLREGDVVLVKGSRGMRMDILVEQLLSSRG